MKAVSRIAPPNCLDNDILEVRIKKERLYNTKEPWNGFSDSDKVCVRDELLVMFDGECAFCGKRLYSGDSGTQADHFLPQISFKYLSLCWENLILLCYNCNKIKGQFSPKSLDGKIFIERFMETAKTTLKDSEVFEKNQVLKNCEDRLIDPSFDDPNEHICFDPASRRFEHLTEKGRLTIERIFNRSKSFDTILKKLSDEMKDAVDNESQPEQKRDLIIRIAGYSFFMLQFYNYWLKIKEKCGDSTK